MLYCLRLRLFFFFFSSRRRHTRFDCDWSSDVCSSDLRSRLYLFKPVAKLVPVRTDTDEIYNFLSGKGAVAGDVVSPAISREDWGELKRSEERRVGKECRSRWSPYH